MFFFYLKRKWAWQKIFIRFILFMAGWWSMSQLTKNLPKAGFVSPLLALRQCRDWGAAISLIDQPLKRLRLIQSIRQITSTIKHRTDSVQNWQLWKISLKTVQEIYWERKREILTPPSAHPAYGFGSLISGYVLSIKEKTFSGLDIKYPLLWYMSWVPIHLRWIKI